MIVMKFGGASVKNAAAVRNVAEIVRNFQSRPIVVVVSAMDKTTNALEKLAHSAVAASETEALNRLNKIQAFHSKIINDLFPTTFGTVEKRIEPYYIEIDRLIRGIFLLQDSPPRVIERIMSFGELLSSAILTEYLNQNNLPTEWLDPRKLITTDSKFEQAEIIWGLTTRKIREAVEPIAAANKIAVVAGYIASNTDGYTVTLGREGSDFTAAIVAHALDAERMIVWKDVPGVMSADPRRDPNAVKLEKLSYERTIEMTFYGAKVLHPKTLKPLYNKQIPLEVRSFIDSSQTGTLIGVENELNVTATMVKEEQVLLDIRPKDFSFLGEHHLTKIFGLIDELGLTVNLMQTSAITLTLCIDDKPEQMNEFVTKLEDSTFKVETKSSLELITKLNINADNWKPDEMAILVQREGLDVRYVIQS